MSSCRLPALHKDFGYPPPTTGDLTPLKQSGTKTHLLQGSTYLIYWKLRLIGKSWKMVYMGNRPGRRRKSSGLIKKKHWTKPTSILKPLTGVSSSWHVERVKPLILS